MSKDADKRAGEYKYECVYDNEVKEGVLFFFLFYSDLRVLFIYLRVLFIYLFVCLFLTLFEEKKCLKSIIN